MSGFIYLWFDRKHKRYYLGKHWGSEDDGYVCSSTWMKRAYKRRPQDFGKRRILERVHTSRRDLSEAERRWGLLIKEEELGNRYYNLERPGKVQWHDDPEKRLTVSEKLSKAAKGRTKSEKTRELLSKSLLGRKRSDEVKLKISVGSKGKTKRGTPKSPETRAKIAAARRKYWEDRKKNRR